MRSGNADADDGSEPILPDLAAHPRPQLTARWAYSVQEFVPDRGGGILHARWQRLRHHGTPEHDLDHQHVVRGSRAGEGTQGVALLGRTEGARHAFRLRIAPRTIALASG